MMAFAYRIISSIIPIIHRNNRTVEQRSSSVRAQNTEKSKIVKLIVWTLGFGRVRTERCAFVFLWSVWWWDAAECLHPRELRRGA